MKNKFNSNFQFIVDADLIKSERAVLILQALLEEELVQCESCIEDLDLDGQFVFFVEQKNLRKTNKYKNKIIVISADESLILPSVFKVNFNSITDISNFLKKIQVSEKISSAKERIRESEYLYEKMKSIEILMSLENINEAKINLFNSFLDLELQLMQEENIENWNVFFKAFSKKSHDIQGIALLKYEELLKQESAFDENTLLFKLPFEDYLISIHFKVFSQEKDAVLVVQLLSTTMRVIELRDQKLVKGDGEIDLWKKVFSKIPYPMAIISDLGDLLIYNESFAKIGILPKECLRFKDLESSEIYKSFYKIKRIDFPINLLNVSYFVFYTVDKNEIPKSKTHKDKQIHINSTVDELGIISSSIAHELNNPLAGILAALSLLSLEDDWSVDALADLSDMKSGARRCKELVEIFLGFSKFSPSAQSKISIQDSFDQALNLLRFRMIESNLRVDIKYIGTLEKFSHQINSSVMSMIFYLISNELMTSYAHHRLVAMTNTGALEGEVLEFSNQIIIRLDEYFEYEDKIAQSKLIQHLLIFEKLEINFLNKEIRLIYRH